MRLLVVTADFPPTVGGMQVYSWELARAWASRASALMLIAPAHAHSGDVDSAAPFPVRRVRYPGDSFVFSATMAIRRAIADHRPDAIFATSWACASGALQARGLARSKVPVFAAAHGRELILRPLARVPPLQRGYDALRRTALRRAEVVFPVSRYTGGLLAELGVDPARIEVVPNGVDPAQYYPADASALRTQLGLAGKTVLLTVGRLVERKGVDTVLSALPGLVRTFPNLAYVIVGEGPDRPRVESLIAASGVASHVHLVGRAPAGTMRDYYNMCDVFVMPARSDQRDVEGFGLVFLEASACGKPVIGARMGGVTDAVRDGETGLLVPPASAEALGEALHALLRDPDRRDAMGEAGRRHVLEEGSWERAARRIFDVMGRPAHG